MCEPTSLATGVKNVLTLLVNSRRSISNAMGVNITRGMDLVPLSFKSPMKDRLSAPFELTNRAHYSLFFHHLHWQIRFAAPH
jgi:hypothetical protein